jgi:hypothetical protein
MSQVKTLVHRINPSLLDEIMANNNSCPATVAKVLETLMSKTYVGDLTVSEVMHIRTLVPTFDFNLIYQNFSSIKD